MQHGRLVLTIFALYSVLAASVAYPQMASADPTSPSPSPGDDESSDSNQKFNIPLEPGMVSPSPRLDTPFFGSAFNLSVNDGTSDGPQIAVFSNKVYVTWHDDTPGNDDILFKRSTDGGATFGGTINLSSNAGSSTDPKIATTGTRVFVVWQDSTPGNYDIFFRASSNSGTSFGSTINLSSNAGHSESPKIAASGSNVYVVWDENRHSGVSFARSIDNGLSFSPVVTISVQGAFPSLAISGTYVYVAWQQSDDIFFRRSMDSGTTFDFPINLSSNAGLSSAQDIAVYGSKVYVVWQDSTPGNGEIST